MILLRLFDRDRPSEQIDSRSLDEGELSIGREPGVGWAIDDPAREISRTHCVVRNRGGVLTVRDTSTNGVFVGEAAQAVGRDGEATLHVGDRLRFGRFLIHVEATAGDALAPSSPFESASARGRDGASPFSPPLGLDAIEGGPRRPDPFASALAADPLAAPRPHPGASFARGGDDDVWERRINTGAGEWDAPPASKRAGHERLIGTEHRWTEPAPAPAQETGFGFDAPFNRPLLRPPEAHLADVGIPSDWDLAAPAPSAAPPAAVHPAPVPAAAAPIVEIPEPKAIVEPPPPRAEPPPAPQPLPAPLQAPSMTPASPTGATPAAADDDRLLQAFCAGARLDPRALAGQDPAAVMGRLGGVYQQMVLGLGDLLGERTSVKNEYRMSRTTLRAEGNNPFKWAPPQRVAVELLRDGGDGFKVGPAAVKEAYGDLKKHLLCMLAGLHAALEHTLGALSPERVTGELEGRGYLIKAQRDAALWNEFTRLYAEFRQQGDDNPDSPVNRAFRDAYERQLQELDSSPARSS